MKKIFILCLMAFVMCSCNSTPTQQTSYQTNYQTEKKEVTLHPLTKFWYDYAIQNPELFNNDVTKKKAADKLYKEFIDSIKVDNTLIKDLPVKFYAFMPYGKGKYICKFVCMSYNSVSIEYYKSYNERYNVSIDLFTIVDEDTISSYKENTMYYVTDFSFIGEGNKQNIWVGNYKLHQESNISNFDGDYDLSLSCIVVKDLKLREIVNR